MTAEFDMNIVLIGEKEDLIKAIDCMKVYCNQENEIYFENLSITEEAESYIKNNEMQFECQGPYGKLTNLGEFKLFEELANCSTNLVFKAEISGYGSYAYQTLHAELAEGVLTTTFTYIDDEEIHTLYANTMKERISYETFVELFEIDEDEFDENAYDEFITDTLHYGDFFEMDAEEFCDEFSAEIGTRKFNKALKSVKQAGWMDYDTFFAIKEPEYTTVIKKSFR